MITSTLEGPVDQKIAKEIAMSREIRLATRPSGIPTADNFVPAVPALGMAAIPAQRPGDGNVSREESDSWPDLRMD